MPKKTKRQKILAHDHRQSGMSYQFNQIETNNPPLVKNTYDHILPQTKAIYSDLTKTLLLATVAISIEIFLFVFRKSF